MSAHDLGLDADLYGDLYGNDDVSPTTQTTPAISQAPAASSTPTQSTSSTIQSPTSLEQKSEPVRRDIPPPPALSSIPTYDSSMQDIAPEAQHIPTYSETDSLESKYIPPPRDGGSYQDMLVKERSVRPSEMKDEGKMFIGGLNWETSDENLRKYFSQFGKVDACTIMRDADGRSRCFAFLTFEDPASVNAVMVREHFLDGKIIDPKRAIPRQEHQRATKLFIGGLPGSVTSESMREFFSQFGKVVDSTVMLDRETGRSKGFGFISFEDTDVTPFLGFGQLEIDGKLIDVKLAQPRAQRESDGGASVYGPHGPSRGRGGFVSSRGGASFGSHMGSAASSVATSSSAVQSSVGTGVGGTTFDPQALANLYTRMFQMGAVNPMMGGMNPMMGGMGMGSMGMGAMGMGRGASMGAGMGGMGAGMGAGMGGAMGAMGRGGAPMNSMAGVPRGPRAAAGGPGPQRAGQRGQHGYHPYAR